MLPSACILALLYTVTLPAVNTAIFTSLHVLIPSASISACLQVREQCPVSSTCIVHSSRERPASAWVHHGSALSYASTCVYVST